MTAGNSPSARAFALLQLFLCYSWPVIIRETIATWNLALGLLLALRHERHELLVFYVPLDLRCVYMLNLAWVSEFLICQNLPICLVRQCVIGQTMVVSKVSLRTFRQRAITQPSTGQCSRQSMQADISEDTYNQALDAWLAAEPQPGPPSPENCWNFTINALDNAIPQPYKPLLSLQVGTRHNSAGLAAHHHLASLSIPPEVARAHCCVAFLDGTLIVSTPDVSTALRYTKPRPLDAPPLANASLSSPNAIDHVYRHAKHTRPGSLPRTLVLYGPPGNPCFARVHRAVVKTLEFFDISDVDYVVRPTLQQGCRPEYSEKLPVDTHSCLRLGSDERPSLSGYGIELALKDTEYVQARPLKTSQDV
jgi:hypothetical protein